VPLLAKGQRAVSAGRILDTRIGLWILDATVVNNFHAGDIAAELVGSLRGRVYLAERVEEEVKSGPARASYQNLGHWYTVWALMLGDQDYQWLVQKFSVDPTKNRGEAESIVIAQRESLIFATDDGVAHAEAIRRRICTSRTPAMLISLVRQATMTVDAAWAAFQLMVRRGREFGELPWNDKADFNRLCAIGGFDECG
jgi:predicted nucleic acid-binding protein